MHESSMKRMEWFIQTYLDGTTFRNILDVGSYNVNGCYKSLFQHEKFKYVGLDMEAGPNVDIVPDSTYQWNEIKDDQFDVVISGQALEHIEFFWVTMAEIVRVTKKGGLICIIAPNGFGEHRYPVDCWRFFTDGMVALARYNQLEVHHSHTNSAPTIKEAEWFSSDCADSMLVARKPYGGEAKPLNLKNYKCTPSDHTELSNGMATYGEYLESRRKDETLDATKDRSSQKRSNLKKGNMSNKRSKLIEFIAAAIKAGKRN